MSTSINRITFVDLVGQLCTIAPDGSDLRRLTESDRFFQFPAWSPDNSQIAAIGSTRRDGAIFVLHDEEREDDPERTEAVLYRSRDESPIYLYWSPSGESISFIATHAELDLGLRLLPHTQRVSNAGRQVDSAAESEPIVVGSPCFWAWEPDGQALLTHVGFASERARLLRAVLYDKEQTLRATGVTPGYFQTPALSPDGASWAYAELDEEGVTSQLVVESVGSKSLIAEHAGVVAFAWAPTNTNKDGEQLAFMHPDGHMQSFYGSIRLWQRGGAVRQLTDDAAFAFFWSPDARWLAYFTLPSTGRRVRVNASANGHATYTNGSTPQSSPIDISTGPSTDIPVDVTTGEPQIELRVVEIASGASHVLSRFTPTAIFVDQFLPFFDQYARSHSLWSPDSRALVVPQLTDEGERLYIIEINGDAPRPLIDGLMPCWSG